MNLFDHIGLLLLDQFRWKNRVLIMFSDSKEFIKQQRKLLDQVIPDLIERDIILIGFGKGDQLYNSQLLKHELKLNLGKQSNSIVLLGKDGSVKAKWIELVQPKVVFDIIDAMPMRQQEMRERRG